MMTFSESLNIVYNRIKNCEAEDDAKKIFGYLLQRGPSDQDMVQFAYGPDSFIQEVIQRVKIELSYKLAVDTNPPVSEFSFPSPYSNQQLTNMHSPDLVKMGYLSPSTEPQTPIQIMNLEDRVSRFPGDYFYQDAALQNLIPRTSQKAQHVPENFVKPCFYFMKGCCKNGSFCRFSHAQGPYMSEGTFCPNLNDYVNEGLPGSLEKLELEIAEILRQRRGNPISIASLPIMYYEEYGKVLRAEGYLTESQRHGKAGYSLTKLIARMKNSIKLIDRPHGQHAIVLAEDAPKYSRNHRHERSNPGPIISGSQQIYLTFPAESTFMEDDVSTYFSSFGTVEDVRIPRQQKRMFGFVTFSSADTVKTILAKGNPHYVSGSRVLVKPYREKAKSAERKYIERSDPLPSQSQHCTEMQHVVHSIPKGFKSPRMLSKQLLAAQEMAREQQRRHFAEVQLAQRTHPNQFTEDDADNLKLQLAERFSYILDVIDDDPKGEVNARHAEIEYANDKSQELDLPENPFEFLASSSDSTVS